MAVTKSTAAKSQAAPKQETAPAPTENPVEETPVVESTPEDKPRIPFEDKIFIDLGTQYLNWVDEINAYNASILEAERQASENVWTQSKLMKEIKSQARPDDKNATPDNEAEKLLSQYENALEAVTSAKQAASKYMADKLGVEMIAEKVKPDENEVARIKEEVRKPLVSLANSFNNVAGFSTDPNIKDKINTFLSDNPIPMVGREGSLDVTKDSAGTPKFRVDVIAERDGKTLISGEDGRGFTKASLSAKKFHNRGEAPTSEMFRDVYVKAGEKDTQFEHKGVVYILKSRSK